MPTTDISGSSEALLEAGETITETGLARLIAKANYSGYRENGLGITADHTNEDYDVATGLAYVRDASADETYPIRVTSQITNEPLATTTGVNYIYLSFDPTADSDSVTLHTLTTDSAPSDPNVKLGEIDASADTVTELNDAPDLDFDMNGRDVDSDDDGIFENADVDALVNFAAGDSFADYPIHNPDVQALQNFAVGDQFADYPLHNPDIQALQNFAVGDQFADYPIHNADIQALQNWSAGDQFGGYPIVAADVAASHESDLSYVRVHLSSNFSHTTANGWETLPLDSEDKDLQNEFDTTNNQFSPGTTGEYEIKMQALFQIGADGDRVSIRFENVTDNVTVVQAIHEVGGATSQSIHTSIDETLTSGKNYEMQVQNFDNDDTIVDNDHQTFLTVKRVPV